MPTYCLWKLDFTELVFWFYTLMNLDFLKWGFLSWLTIYNKQNLLT